MKIALITDTHAGARGDSIAFNDYFFKFWDNTFFPYLKEHNIKHIIHLGDAVDRQKFISYNIAHSWRTRFWNRLRDEGVTVDVLVGNHDAPNHKNTNTPNAIEELFGAYNNVTVHSECRLKIFGKTQIALIPWINKSNYDSTMEFIDKTTATIAMGHLELKGFEMDRGNVAKLGMDRDVFIKFQIVMSGHYHHRSTDGKIWYLGNPYEITWADYHDPRGFHTFDTDTRLLTFFPNPYRMFHKITYNEGIVEKSLDNEDLQGAWIRVTVEKKDKKFDSFLEALRELKPHRIDVDEVTEQLTSTAVLGDVRDTITLMNNYVDGSDTTLDKDRLKLLLRNLYTEAHDSI